MRCTAVLFERVREQRSLFALSGWGLLDLCDLLGYVCWALCRSEKKGRRHECQASESMYEICFACFTSAFSKEAEGISGSLWRVRVYQCQCIQSDNAWSVLIHLVLVSFSLCRAHFFDTD